jgi:hypothetical protein
MVFVPPLPTKYALTKVAAVLPGEATIDVPRMKDEERLALTICDAANAGTPKPRRRRTAKSPVKLLLLCLAISRIIVFLFLRHLLFVVFVYVVPALRALAAVMNAFETSARISSASVMRSPTRSAL